MADAVDPLVFAASAALLAIERVTYIAICHHPGAVRAWAAHPWLAWLGGPVEFIRALFACFKLIQGGVFLMWLRVHGDGVLRLVDEPQALLAALALLVAGQALNLSVFARLGAAGVFYGSRFGYRVRWVRGFPFSLTAHPQYVGTVVSIWAVFLATRYPFPDWWVLPALETVYYAVGGWLERDI